MTSDVSPTPMKFHRSRSSIAMPSKEAVRSCGPCTLCCKVMGINDGDFVKPKDQWCQHAKKGVGCSIYATRPGPCQSFQCLWVATPGSDLSLRPDKVHGFLTPSTDGKSFVLHEDPGYAGAATIAFREKIQGWMKLDPENYVIVVSGTKRTFFGQMEKFEKLRAVGAAEAAEIKDVRVIR